MPKLLWISLSDTAPSIWSPRLDGFNEYFYYLKDSQDELIISIVISKLLIKTPGKFVQELIETSITQLFFQHFPALCRTL